MRRNSVVVPKKSLEEIRREYGAPILVRDYCHGEFTEESLSISGRARIDPLAGSAGVDGAVATGLVRVATCEIGPDTALPTADDEGARGLFAQHWPN